jgi:tight adherence protein B
VTVRFEHSGTLAASTLRLEYPALPAPPEPPPTTPPQEVPEALLPVAAGDDAASWALVLGASCVAIALFLLGQIAFAPRGRRIRLGRLGAVRRSVPDSSAISDIVERATSSADAALERRGRRASLNAWLERAGIALRPGEFVVLALSAIAIGFAVGFVAFGLIAGAALAAIAAAMLYFVPQVMADRRRQRFSEQLPETLQLLSGSLRAGYGLIQAIDMLSRECPEPTGGEFRRLVVEGRLGRDISHSLEAMSRRIGTEDFEWVVQAIDIHREVGGDLAEVLDTVAATIRERNQVMRQVKTLTAEGRLSAYILTALPVVLAVALRLINPGYFELLTHGVGLAISATAAGLLVVGALWFRKLCQLDY